MESEVKMHGMRALRTALSVVVLSSCASASRRTEEQHAIRPQSGGELVGKWAADARTRGGLGSTMVFSNDGVMTMIFGALVDFRYKVDDNTLTTVYKEGETTEPHKLQPYWIDGDRMILAPDDPAERLEMIRIGQPIAGVHPVVGVWEFKHYTGVPATFHYTTQGLAQLSVPFQTTRGRYRVQSKSLTILVEGQEPKTVEFELDGGALTLLEPGGPKRFTRVVP